MVDPVRGSTLPSAGWGLASKRRSGLGPGYGPWARPSFRILWSAAATSGFGTATGAGVISLVAILVLDATTSQVTVMIALGGVAAVLSLPAGPLVERRRKRPAMVAGGTFTSCHRYARCSGMPWCSAAASPSPHRSWRSSCCAIWSWRPGGTPSPWGYALALGIPAVGGVIGSSASTCLVRRLGERRVLLLAGVSRTLWMPVIPLSPPGLGGLAIVLGSEFLLMLSAGISNPVFATCRMRLISRDHMARVGAAWPMTAKTVQPLFILAGGLLAELVGVRGALAITAVVLVGSSLLLPWRHVLRAEADGLSRVGTLPVRG